MQDYDIIKEIGSGSFGKVCKIRRKTDGREMACKEINYRNLSEKEKGQIVSEVNILRELNNPFIVRYYDRIIDQKSSRLYIVMELCSGGDLGKVIQKCQKENSSIHEEVIWKIYAQIACALKESHRHMEKNVCKPILHRDIKPANIFLDSRQNIKIGDFGLAKELSSAKTNAHTNVGTPFYMSPELINGKSYDERSDIWSLGCLLYELACLKPPHHDAKGTKDLVLKINSGRVRRIPSEYSSELWKTIQELMSVDLNKRPRIEDVLNSKSPIFIKSLCAANKIVQDFKVELAVDKLSKEKDDLYRNKEQSLKNRENSLLQKEHAISKQENEVNAKQKQLDTREQQLNAREQQLNAREQLLNTREQQLLVRDKEVSMDNNQKEVTEPSSAVHANTKTNTSAASTRKPTTTSFKVYADPPNQNPPHVTRSKNCAVTEYMIPTAESDVNTTTGPPSANTRHRLIGDGQPNAIGVTNTLGKISDISEGVKRAKEILHRPASNNTNVAVMLGKENNGAIPSKTKPLMPPPPPPMNAIGIVTGLTTNANTMRKRSIPSRDKIDTKESPLKKPRFTGMPLQLPRSENNIQNKTTAHAYLNQKYVHQQHQVIGVSNNNNGTSSNLRDATALL